MTGTPIPPTIFPARRRIAQLAREAPQRAFLSLAHYIDLALLREAFRRTRKDGATGVDGQTAAAYAERLDENLRSLLDRFKSGRYRAPVLRRTYIPKGRRGERRPIGIPTFEDKVLQRAVALVLEAVYEQDFLDCSYGFRPGRSAHQALRALWQGVMRMGGGWVVDVDLQRLFDTLDHGQLRRFLDQRVRDGVLRRTMNTWLKAGVLEGTTVSYPDRGTPQGGVISPLLANIYLHEVVDRWFAAVIQSRLKGRAFLIRYADDLVIVCTHEAEARGILEALAQRLEQYGLALHPEKTRVVPFTRPRIDPPTPLTHGGSRPRSVEFLGFTHYWGKSQKGHWVVKRKTAPSRFGRTLKRIAQWCRTYRHQPLLWQHQQLARKLRGHDAYYGVTGNLLALRHLRYEVARVWRKWLSRRCHKPCLPWERFQLLLGRYPLPCAVVHHTL